MSPLFDVAELIRIGVEDEKSGVAFYGELARTTAHPRLRGLYESLVEQERGHQERFEQMLADLGDYKPAETYPGEYIAYLRALLDSRAFPDPGAAAQAAHDCQDDRAALVLALRFERDTLGLLNELRDLVAQDDQELVDELIREEQGHVVELSWAINGLGE